MLILRGSYFRFNLFHHHEMAVSYWPTHQLSPLSPLLNYTEGLQNLTMTFKKCYQTGVGMTGEITRFCVRYGVTFTFTRVWKGIFLLCNKNLSYRNTKVCLCSVIKIYSRSWRL